MKASLRSTVAALIALAGCSPAGAAAAERSGSCGGHFIEDARVKCL